METPTESLASRRIPTFRKVADLLLDNSERGNKTTTVRMRKLYLQSCVDRFDKMRVTSTLCP